MKRPRVLTTIGSWSAAIIQRMGEAGADVRVFNPACPLSHQYRWASHVLLPGGADIHPAYYREPVLFARPGAIGRDEIEHELAIRSLRDAKPLFGICRGHQMICVAAGGDLYQDIQIYTSLPHRAATHRVRLTARGWMGLHRGHRFTVNSFHHQAARRVPAGWRVAVRSTDGLVEAIAHPELPVLSVQWHPEVMEDRLSSALFEHFLSAHRSPLP